MKSWMLVATLTIIVFSTQLTAQTLRVDASLARSESFKSGRLQITPKIGQRSYHKSYKSNFDTVGAATSLSPLRGSASMSETTVGAWSGGYGMHDIAERTMDMAVAFTSLKLGVNVKADEGLSFNVGFQNDQFKTGYPNQFTVGITGNGAYSTSLRGLLLNSIKWTKEYTEGRTGLYLGLTKDINFQ